MNNQIATFGGGCFWGVEESFRSLNGVVDTAVGYMGGTTEKPTYEEVCSDKTGHAEVVRVTYDPAIVSYEMLLDHFFKIHNPTTLNRQGSDIGTQYRSIIFFHTDEQEKEAKNKIEELNVKNTFGKPVVTEVIPAGIFNQAEEYHQQYLAKKGLSTCHI
jgi:peptide-methionine (S)-S-oxide reductase